MIKQPTMLQSEDVPAAVRDHVLFALNVLREQERVLAAVKHVHGHKHMLALELQDRRATIVQEQGKLAKFRTLAAKNGVDADSVINELGGEPSFERFGMAAVPCAPANVAQQASTDGGAETAQLDAPQVLMMHECMSIRRGEHPEWHGDKVANAEVFLHRFANLWPQDALKLADGLRAQTSAFSLELGISPERVGFYANRLQEAASRATASRTTAAHA